ncbi:E3 binding domain-containing protein, partial [Burkholderia cenocepacia]|nr:E3 binding domain-containing protein [Burkholderia cenocepacia]
IVDTSKAAVEIESWHEGTVDELLLEPGERIPVGTPMATLLEPGEAPPAVRYVRRPAAPVAPASAPSRRKISPAARKLVQQHRIDPDSVSGTGPVGSVTL